MFKDVDSIPAGSRFEEVIRRAIADASLVLIIIGKQWLDIRDAQGRRRLEDEADYVRLEIEEALKQGRPVLPVLLDDAAMPDAETLPPALRPLCQRNGIRVRPDPDFQTDTRRLIEAARSALPSTVMPRLIAAAAVFACAGALWFSQAAWLPALEAWFGETGSKRSTDPEPIDARRPEPPEAKPGKPLSFNKGSYYESLSGLTGPALARALARLTRRDHRVLNYKEAREHTAEIHADPYEPEKLRVFYDYKLVPIADFPKAWNREHIWPKSQGLSSHRDIYADLHNIVPADPKQNARRGKLPFSESDARDSFRIDPSVHGDIRGDLARILFYMAVRYQGVGGEPDLQLTDAPSNPGEPYFGPLTLLKRWHREDGVGIEERERNERIHRIQGNRNPFVDRPGLAEALWGE